jgi:hypothetical protein
VTDAIAILAVPSSGFNVPGLLDVGFGFGFQFLVSGVGFQVSGNLAFVVPAG